MASFIQAAQKKVTDIRSYLREQSNGNQVKYRAEIGKVHLIYIPFEEVPCTDDEGNTTMQRQIKCISGSVHEWSTPDGKYHSTICLKDTIRKDEATGAILNDGTCPFCDRVSDAWDIYNMRKAHEEEVCKLPAGPQREEHMKSAARVFGDERKAKPASEYVYLLVVQFRIDDEKKPIMVDGLPSYDLRVMKLSAKRLTKIVDQISNSGEEMAGSELMFNYPKTNELRLAVGQSTINLVFPSKKLTTVYGEKLMKKIDADVAKFSFDGLDKQGFPEWAGMTTESAKAVTDAQFEQWDKYQKELKVNPNAQYLEYITSTPENNPSLTGAPAVPSIAAPSVAAPNVAVPGVAMPGAADNGAPAVPDIGAGNISDLFGGTGPSTIQL